jgi:glycosyl transferase, family 25
MFERAFIVNLPNRTDRRREMERELARVGLSAEFFPAFRFDDPANFINIGSRGCFMSHMEALRSAIGAKSVLMMEDDLNFVRDFKKRSAIIDKLPASWDIFYGSFVGIEFIKGPQKLIEIAPSREAVGSHFYAVSGRIIADLIAAMEVMLRDSPPGPDGALNIFRRDNPQLKVFAAYPALGYQRPSASDCTPKLRDKIPFISYARRFRHWLLYD